MVWTAAFSNAERSQHQDRAERGPFSVIPIPTARVRLMRRAQQRQDTQAGTPLRRTDHRIDCCEPVQAMSCVAVSSMVVHAAPKAMSHLI